MAVRTIKKGSLEYLSADNITAPHCFTTRQGGISKGYLESLNLGADRGEPKENVEKNFEILGRELGFEINDLVLTHQTHSDIVRVVGREDAISCFHRDMPECDALVTNAPGLALMIFTADCTPLLLHDPVTGAVGAAHAGWRGTASAIGAKTVRAMVEHFGCKPENIRAAIGPNIAQCCFETDADVPDALHTALGREVDAFVETRGSKFFIDLKQVNALILRRAGVQHIEISDDCTACQHQRFWSHRVTKGQRGSQGAIIVCKEVTR
jgi:YfiH family protein